MRIHYNGAVDIDISFRKLKSNYDKAQRLLNMQVTADCDPYVPMRQGGLANSVRYPDGIEGGVIEYDSPYAHYMYEGELYLAENGSSWAKKYEKKYPSGKALNYSTYAHAQATDHWFEVAKREHKQDWIDLVRRQFK